MVMQLKMVRSGALKFFRQQISHHTVSFNITDNCNYKCKYCALDQQDFHISHLPREFINRVIDICAECGNISSLHFSGGEPSVHPHFYDILSYARSKGEWTLSCTTNGSGGKKLFKKIFDIDHNTKNTVSVHLDYYNHKHISQIVEQLSFFQTRQTLLIPCIPGKIKQIESIIDIARQVKNIDINISALFDSTTGKNLYFYDDSEIFFIKSIMRNKMCSNFSDFVDESGNIYRIHGTPNSFLPGLNLFRHYMGMQCTTCSKINKVRNMKLYPLLCDFNIYNNEIDKNSFFKNNYIKCKNLLCLCNGHTFYPKFSEKKWAPTYLGGDKKFDVDAIYPKLIHKNDINIRFVQNIPQFFLK